jgi:hypothetical protein
MRYIGLALIVLAAACGGGLDDAGDPPNEATSPLTVAASETTQAALPTTTTSDSGSETTASTVRDDVPSNGELAEQLVPDENTATTDGPAERPPAESPPDVSDFVASATADLAERLGVDPAAIGVVLTEQVTWRSSALGCPEPDRGYLDVLTPGQRTVLTYDGIEYHYHGGEQPFLCAAPEEPLPPSADPNA